MPKQNPYLIKENYKKTETVQELKDKYEVPSYEEFMKSYEPNEEVEVITEAEYQDRVLHGSQFGPGNEQSTTAAIVAGVTVTVVGGVVTVATGGVGVPAVAALGARVAQDAFQVYHVRNHLEAQCLVLGLGLGAGALAALTNGEQRNYLLQIGYSDKGSTYSLYELKRTAKYHEKELLTEQSKVYIQQWINDNDYSSGEERDRRERVTNGKSGDDKRFYRWDNTHNDIEVYDRRGRHLGSMDPRTGKMYKAERDTCIGYSSSFREFYLERPGIETSNLRMIKSEKEIKRMRRVAQITDQVYQKLLKTVQVGMKEKDLAKLIRNFFEEFGADGLAFDTIVVSGKNGALPHGQPSDKIIKEGELITVDFGGKYQGYCSDFTRTFAVGKEINPKLKEIYQI
ncbi:8606_t:CDS:2, partial [Funneliformis geosporum]